MPYPSGWFRSWDQPTGYPSPGLLQAADAARLGYPELEKIARTVRVACEETSKPGIQESLVELTEVARRIRLGHRGAA